MAVIMGVDPADGSYAAFPAEYTVVERIASKPGADWFIEGNRYREVRRLRAGDSETITLERADIEPPLGLRAIRAEKS